VAINDQVPTGQPAKVFTGIRDVPIYAGESSRGNRLPGGPYRSAELITIGAIMLPALWWFRTHPDAGFSVLLLAALISGALTVVLRLVLPKRRPSLAARAAFAVASVLPRHVCAAPDRKLRGHGRQR
jgi:hypothetical protein